MADAPVRLTAIAGVSPYGEDVTVPIGEGHRILVFLTAGCRECRGLWASMSDADPHGRVVLVTPSPSTESRRRVARLVPPGASAVMSSAAWHAFGVTKAPWWFAVADGVVTASGPAPADWGALPRSRRD